jgi:S1-C subfamily serine protease
MRARLSLAVLLPAAIIAAVGADSSAQEGPSFATREAALKSLVYVRANDCPDNAPRAGSGFAFENPGQIVTAHHVVGGCRTVNISYEGVSPAGPRLHRAEVARVLPWGDLALLTVAAPPSVPVLKLAPQRPDRSRVYYGAGYQNGQPTAGDKEVTFTPGSSSLTDILPEEAKNELRRNRSAIDVSREVLRFNVALQPGMSGGPIIDATGSVVGIVAGGLKAGAAPASWGWPSGWVADLLASTDARNQTVTVAGVYYTLAEMNAEAAAIRSGREITCGSLEFSYRGSRRFADVARGADDQARLQHIMAISTRPREEIDAFNFEIWVHAQSGATAVTPAGYTIGREGDVCAIASRSGPFRQVIWAAAATDQFQIMQVSLQFERAVMLPRAPYQFGFNPDPALTTPGPQFRPNGMVFNRKGFTQPKAPWMPGGPAPPLAHTFETLIAKSGSFLGVGTMNDELPPMLQFCVQIGFRAPECGALIPYVREWTHFILATQLSTYPST